MHFDWRRHRQAALEGATSKWKKSMDHAFTEAEYAALAYARALTPEERSTPAPAASGTAPQLRSGWKGAATCTCNNTRSDFLNCDEVPSSGRGGRWQLRAAMPMNSTEPSG